MNFDTQRFLCVPHKPHISIIIKTRIRLNLDSGVHNKQHSLFIVLLAEKKKYITIEPTFICLLLLLLLNCWFVKYLIKLDSEVCSSLQV